MRNFKDITRLLLGRRDFLVLVFCNVIIGLTYSFVLPFISTFGTKEVGMSSGFFGIYMTVTTLAGIFLSTLLAKWSDSRLSRKTVLILGGTCGVAGYLGYAFVREVWLLLIIGSTLLGISAISFGQLFAHARDVLNRNDIPAGEAPLYMNIFRLFFSLSWVVGPAISAWILNHHSFTTLYCAAAGLFAMFVIVVIFFIPAIPPSAQSRRAVAKISTRSLVRIPGLVAHFAGFVLFFSCSTLSMMNLPLMILNTLHGSETQVGIAYSVAPIFELPVMFYVGLLATRHEVSKLIRLSMVIAAVYFGGLFLVRAPWQIYPIQILNTAVVAVTSGVAITFFQDFLPDLAGIATNIYSNANRAGAIVGYLLFGYLSSRFGFRSVFLVCASFSVISFAIMHFWNPKRIPMRARRAALRMAEGA